MTDGQARRSVSLGTAPGRWLIVVTVLVTGDGSVGFFLAEHLDARVNQECAKDVNDPMKALD